MVAFNIRRHIDISVRPWWRQYVCVWMNVILLTNFVEVSWFFYVIVLYCNKQIHISSITFLDLVSLHVAAGHCGLPDFPHRPTGVARCARRIQVYMTMTMFVITSHIKCVWYSSALQPARKFLPTMGHVFSSSIGAKQTKGNQFCGGT